MSWTRSTTFVFLVVFAAALCLPTASRAQSCSAEAVSTVTPPDAPGAPPAPATSGNGGAGIQPTAAPANGPTLNQEGLTERPADLLIYDNGVATHCFPVGRQIVVTYNAALTTPNPVAVSGSDLDVIDSAGASGLVVNVTTTVGLSSFNTPQTVITITVLQAGTAGNLTSSYTGSAIRLKNLRFDVTSLAGAADPHVYATVSTANPVDLVEPTPLASGSERLTVGIAEPTSGGAALQLLGPEGQGFQSTPTGLCNPSSLAFIEGFPNAFRTAITSQAVYNDIPTGPTSLIFNVTGIPSGVTVTFPSSLSTSAEFGPFGLTFAARSSTLNATGGNLSVIYDTTQNNPGVDGELWWQTADAAATESGTIFPKDLPRVGVAVSSLTGNGTAEIQAIFGPTPTAQGGDFAGMDDVQANAIPRYISNTSITAPSRLIISGDFFTINPVETVLLYPYVTDTNGFVTGLEVANTGNSSKIFTATTCANGEPDPPVNNGAVTFYFFPNGGTPFTYTTAAGSPGRGLDANGLLDAGNIYAVSIDDLLTAAGQSSMVGKFDGYVMAVNQFNYAHGFSVIFDSTGHGVGSSPAEVVGPSSSGERSGQVKLPESLGLFTRIKH